METLSLNLNERYSYADYLNWFDKKRRELIDGFANLMSAPLRKHQKISMQISMEISYYLKHKKCEIYSAPFDVRLPKNGETEDDKIYNVVQPDIVVVCDPKKLDRRGCVGAPDLIVEILSPSTSKRDLKDKYFLYEESGVTEYWVAYPEMSSIHVFMLNKNNKYEQKAIYVQDDKISPSMFPDLKIDINEIFS